MSSLRSTRQRFNCGIVQKNYAEWIRNRLVEEFFTRMLSSLRYLSHICSALRLLEAPVGVLAETTEIIRGAHEVVCGRRPLHASIKAEHTRALTLG